MDAAVEDRGWRPGAKAETTNRFERNDAVGSGVAERDAEPLLGARRDRVAARGLTGFGAAELQHMAACGLPSEVVIEGDDAMHLGARDVQRLRDQRLGCFIDIAELLDEG